ncbi:MAG: polymer-forming cytoskeletal protein [Candidatus Paceibacterota bacterium]
MKNKIFKQFFVAAFVFCFLSGAVVVAEDNIDSNVPVSSAENVPTDLARAGETVDEGRDVDGDVMLAGTNVSYSGNATGDILLAGGTARVSGNCAGDVRIVGGTITLNGVVDKNVTVAGGNVVFGENSVVKGNLYVVGGSVELRGLVEGNATARGSQLIFSGKVNSNADFRSSKITARSDARIDGNLIYASNSDFEANQSIVVGSIEKVPLENYVSNYTKNGKTGDASNAGFVILQFLSLLIVVLLLSKLFSKQLKEITLPITKAEIWNRLAFGLVSLVLNLLIIVITLLTIVGAPVALIVLFSYIVLLIIASAITPILLGRLVNLKVKLYGEGENVLLKDFIFGYVLMQIIGLVPFLGGLALFFFFLFSFGRVTRYVFMALKENR